MNKIITIGREFGSGGREIGKRMAETLGIAYYDDEIITAIAERSSLAEDYVKQVVENRITTYYPITIATSFAAIPDDSTYGVNRSIFAAQTEILKEMAEKSDCVIVGRCADHVLADYNPLRIFIYASMESKIARCRMKSTVDAALSDKELEKKIRKVDKARAQYYRFYTGEELSDRLSHDIAINASGANIKQLALGVAELVKAVKFCD